MLEITYIPAFSDNYIWLIKNTQTKTCIVVDPGIYQPVINWLNQNNYQLQAILITHHHNDHTGGVTELKTATNADIYAPKLDNVSCDYPVIGDEILELIDYQIKILPTYGHTLGHVSYLIGNNLFCGDTLFGAGCGRVFEGTYEQMFNSLNKIANLPRDTKIFCAHEYTLANLNFAQMIEPNNLLIAERIKQVTELRTINLPSIPSFLSDEINTNPFLRCDKPEVVRNSSNYAGKKLTNNLAVFKALRNWKNNI